MLVYVLYYMLVYVLYVLYYMLVYVLYYILTRLWVLDEPLKGQSTV